MSFPSRNVAWLVLSLTAGVALVHCGGDEPAGNGDADASSSGGGSSGTSSGNSSGGGSSGGGSSSGGSSSGSTSSSGSSGEDAGTDGAVEGQHHTYVVDGLRYPASNAEAQQFGLDVDGDGIVDNKLGTGIAAIEQQGLGLNAYATAAVDRGVIVVLGDLRSTSLVAASQAGFSLYSGANPVPAPCASEGDCRQHLAGDATFDLAANTPANSLVVGSIDAATFRGAGGELPLQLPVMGGIANVRLRSASAELVTLSEQGFAASKIAGALSEDDVNEQIYPAMQQGVMAMVSASCEGAPPACGCEPESSGESMLNLFDSNDDCEVSVTELRSSFLASLFTPDLDLDDDGVRESLSIGFRITAKKATFTPPE